MADQRQARAELVAILRAGLEEIAVRKAAEKAERRAKLQVVAGGRRRDAA